jgi:hypothetical protein
MQFLGRNGRWMTKLQQFMSTLMDAAEATRGRLEGEAW